MMGVGFRELGMGVVFILLTELVIIAVTGVLSVRMVLMTLGLSAVLVLAFLAGVEYAALQRSAISM